jgi:hypothetical protein
MFIYELLLSIMYKLMIIPAAVHVHHVRVYVLMYELMLFMYKYNENEHVHPVTKNMSPLKMNYYTFIMSYTPRR